MNLRKQSYQKVRHYCSAHLVVVDPSIDIGDADDADNLASLDLCHNGIEPDAAAVRLISATSYASVDSREGDMVNNFLDFDGTDKAFLILSSC